MIYRPPEFPLSGPGDIMILEVCAPQGPGQALPAPYQRHVAGTSRQCACAVSLPNCLCILVRVCLDYVRFEEQCGVEGTA